MNTKCKVVDILFDGYLVGDGFVDSNHELTIAIDDSNKEFYELIVPKCNRESFYVQYSCDKTMHKARYLVSSVLNGDVVASVVSGVVIETAQ